MAATPSRPPLRFPTTQDADSNFKPDTFSDLKPDSGPI
jgi:hypothetical protein